MSPKTDDELLMEAEAIVVEGLDVSFVGGDNADPLNKQVHDVYEYLKECRDSENVQPDVIKEVKNG